ncbi:hypothetical protein GCM10027347_17750 [Larkinella harenae]
MEKLNVDIVIGFVLVALHIWNAIQWIDKKAIQEDIMDLKDQLNSLERDVYHSRTRLPRDKGECN